jgi:hypothetical protein
MRKSDKHIRKNEILKAIHEVLGRKKPSDYGKKPLKKKTDRKNK